MLYNAFPAALKEATSSSFSEQWFAGSLIATYFLNLTFELQFIIDRNT